MEKDNTHQNAKMINISSVISSMCLSPEEIFRQVN